MNELDKIFQSKLENHTSEYSEQSWDKIQSRLKQQKTKPRKLPWLWMSLAAIVVVGALFLLVPSSDVIDSGSNGNNKAGGSATNSLAMNSAGTATAGMSNENSDDQSSVGSSSTEKSMQSDTKNAKHISTASSERITTAITNENQLKSNNTNEGTLTSADITVANDKINKIKKEVAISSSIENRLSDNINPDGTNVIKGSVNTRLQNAFEASTPSVGLTTNDLISSTRSESIRPLRTIGVSAFTKLYSDDIDGDLLLSKSMMDDFRQDCPSFITDRTGVYLDFYVSHELPFSTLSSKEPELDSYAALRAETEGPTYSFSAGMRLTLMLPNGLGLKTGLNYSQVNEKFSYVDPESDQVKEVITKIINSDGTETIDTSTIIIPGRRDIVSTNKYRSFDIPLLLSYEWDVRERTYMTVNGGIYLNLLFKESGKILDASGEVIDLTDTSGDQLAIFKNNIGLSLFGSVGLHYRWNSSIDFILEPNVRLLVKSATVDGYPLDHKWITAGLITGMRYNF